jgi:hypothetical protein
MRIYFLAFLALVLGSCSDDIIKDEATVQGLVNNDFYKAVSATASVDENGLFSIRSSSTEVISFRTESMNLGTYTVTPNGLNTASYENVNGVVYTSNHDDVVGEITITQVDENGFDGTFFFNLKNAEGEEVFIRSGSFFNVPLLDAEIDDPTEPTNPDEFLTADVDATAFQANVVNIQESSGVFTVFGSVDNVVITIVFPNTLAGGNYDVSTEDNIQLGYSESETVEFAETGNLTISEITDSSISGSFEFITTTGIEVSSGEFSVNL